jgi:hypothetical protein
MGFPPVTMATMVTIGKIVAAVKTAATVAVAATVAKGAYDTWNPPKVDTPSLQTVNYNPGGAKYEYAPTQDVNVGFQNYMNNLTRIAPYYVSRYNQDNKLRKDYVANINLKEKQAASDQPKIHSLRLGKAKQQLSERRY